MYYSCKKKWVGIVKLRIIYLRKVPCLAARIIRGRSGDQVERKGEIRERRLGGKSKCVRLTP